MIAISLQKKASQKRCGAAIAFRSPPHAKLYIQGQYLRFKLFYTDKTCHFISKWLRSMVVWCHPFSWYRDGIARIVETRRVIECNGGGVGPEDHSRPSSGLRRRHSCPGFRCRLRPRPIRIQDGQPRQVGPTVNSPREQHRPVTFARHQPTATDGRMDGERARRSGEREGDRWAKSRGVRGSSARVGLVSRSPAAR